jgi:hypothetical protein
VLGFEKLNGENALNSWRALVRVERNRVRRCPVSVSSSGGLEQNEGEKRGGSVCIRRLGELTGKTGMRWWCMPSEIVRTGLDSASSP